MQQYKTVSFEEAIVMDKMGVAVFWKDYPHQHCWVAKSYSPTALGEASGDENRIWGVQVDEQ